jgi:hypothetical protein
MSEAKSDERDRLIGRIAAIAAENGGSAVVGDLLSRIANPALRRDALWQTIRQMAERSAADPIDFLEQQLDSQSAITFDAVSREAMSALAERDGARAVEFVLRVETAADRDKALLWVLSSWRAENPQAAMKWLTMQPVQTLPPAAPAWVGTLEGLARSVPADFERWVNELPPGELRSQAGQVLARGYALQGKVEEAMRLFQKFAEEDAALPDIQFLGRSIAGTDPVTAATWVSQLPTSPARTRVVEGLVTNWTQKDPNATAAWVESLPPGSIRDAATAAMAQSIARVTPATAAEWVTQISDSKSKLEAAEKVFLLWRLDDPAAARDWIGKVDGLSDRSRARILRTYR